MKKRGGEERSGGEKRGVSDRKSERMGKQKDRNKKAQENVLVGRWRP